MIRTLLISKKEIVRAGIKCVLAAIPDIEVIKEVSNNKTEIIQVIKNLHPQIVFMDIDMQDINCFDVIKYILRFNAATKIIVLSTFRQNLYPAYLLQAGVRGYISNDCTAAEIIKATRTVLLDKIYLNVNIAQMLLIMQIDIKSKFGFEWLSLRQLQITLLILAGKNIHQIANELYISPKTTLGYRSKLLKKINASNDVQLVLRAKELGVFEN